MDRGLGTYAQLDLFDRVDDVADVDGRTAPARAVRLPREPLEIGRGGKQQLVSPKLLCAGALFLLGLCELLLAVGGLDGGFAPA